MKRIYVNSNSYIIFANNTDTSIDTRMPSDNVYLEKNGTLLIFYKKTDDSIILSIDYSDVLNESGVAYASIAVFVGLIESATNGDNSSSTFVADETNFVASDLLNGASKDQNVNGSVTPVEFSYSPPAGFNLIAARIIFYMEDTTVFNSNLFGGLTELTNGWTMSINGVDGMTAKNNRDLGTYMFDMQGVKIFGKEDKTMIGRFSFNKITNGAEGLTIRDGENISFIVKDDLTGLSYLEAKVMGVLKPI